MAGGRTSILRNTMRNLLEQHGKAGIEFSTIAERFGSIDRRQLHKLLHNMRLAGEARCERQGFGLAGRWFFIPASERRLMSMENERRCTRYAQHLDQVAPLQFYGDRLPAGRCASVWVYAGRMGGIAA